MATDISRFGLEALKTTNINPDKSDWIEYWQEDIIFVHNPVFKCRNKEPYKPHQTIAVICENGEASISINFKPCRIRKDTCLIVLADHIVELYDMSPNFKATYIFMSTAFLSQLNINDSYKFYESVEKRPLYHLNEKEAQALNSYISMSKAILQIKTSSPGTSEAILLLTKVFFLTLGWFMHSDATTVKSSGRHFDIMNNYLELVKQHYQEHRDVDFYARKMNMTAKYMSTAVKKASGKSALKWIEEYVILDAKAQLASTTDTIQQICYNLNFPSQSFFGRYFKRAVGMSPYHYRRRARLGNVDTDGCPSDA